MAPCGSEILTNVRKVRESRGLINKGKVRTSRSKVDGTLQPQESTVNIGGGK
jgi:hypothetical protein